MTGLIKGVLSALGVATTTIASIVIAKNKDDRKEWLDEMGGRVDKTFKTIENSVDKAIDKIKDSLD